MGLGVRLQLRHRHRVVTFDKVLAKFAVTFCEVETAHFANQLPHLRQCVTFLCRHQSRTPISPSMLNDATSHFSRCFRSYSVDCLRRRPDLRLPRPTRDDSKNLSRENAMPRAEFEVESPLL